MSLSSWEIGDVESSINFGLVVGLGFFASLTVRLA